MPINKEFHKIGGGNCNSAISRESSFDIAKGLGIIFMVFGHTFYYGHQFIALFNMSLFFIISGYFFKPVNYENFINVINFIIRKIKSLFVPFVIANIILVLLHNVLLDVGLLTNNPEFLNVEYGNIQGITKYYNNILERIVWVLLFFHKEQLVGATWFLRALFWISISFCTISFLINKLIKNNTILEIVRFVICLLCLGIGFLFHKIDFNFYSIGTMFSGAIIFEFGVLYRRFKDKIPITLPVSILSFLFLILFLYLYPETNLLAPHIKCNPIEFSANSYNNPIEYCLCAISGFLLIFYISKKIQKFKILHNILTYIGQRTMAILCLHLIFFKLVTILQVKIYNLPHIMLASHPVIYNQNGWWLVYTILGICGPLLLQFIYEKLKIIRN